MIGILAGVAGAAYGLYALDGAIVRRKVAKIESKKAHEDLIWSAKNAGYAIKRSMDRGVVNSKVIANNILADIERRKYEAAKDAWHALKAAEKSRIEKKFYNARSWDCENYYGPSEKECIQYMMNAIQH